MNTFYFEPKCLYCRNTLQPIGDRRINGSCINDWSTRCYHKKCYGKLLNYDKIRASIQYKYNLALQQLHSMEEKLEFAKQRKIQDDFFIANRIEREVELQNKRALEKHQEFLMSEQHKIYNNKPVKYDKDDNMIEMKGFFIFQYLDDEPIYLRN